MFDPKKFVGESPLQRTKTVMWSRAVTVGKKLPTVKKMKGETLLAGYSGREGCFSALVGENGVLVKIYAQDPKTVALSKPPPVAEKIIAEVPGWGFDAIKFLKETLQK